MKNLLLFVLIILLLSCSDNPTDNPNNDLPDYSKITFSPDSIYLSPKIKDHFINFKGIDFNKNEVDSIKVSDNKIDIISFNKDSLTAKIANIQPGLHRIKMFIKSDTITLSKYLEVFEYIYPEPSDTNIFFTPDTISLSPDNPEILLTFFGTDFFKYKIDSVKLNDYKLMYVNKFKDSIIFKSLTFIYGTYDVFIYYKGNKIKLNKQVTIKNDFYEVDFTKFSNIRFEVKDLPVRVVNYSGEYYYGQGSGSRDTSDRLTTFSTKDPYKFERSKMLDFFNWTQPYLSVGLASKFDIYFDKTKNKIKSLLIQTQYNTMIGGAFIDESYTLRFNNIDYKIVQNPDGSQKMKIEIVGESINNSIPLVKRNYRSEAGRNTVYISGSYYLTKIDDITKKEINYYPANKDTKIIIEIY